MVAFVRTVSVSSGGCLKGENLDLVAPTFPVDLDLKDVDIPLPFDLEDLRQHRLSDATYLLRDEAAVAEEQAAFEVEGSGVVERGGKFESAEEEFGGEAVEHDGRVDRVRGEGGEF
jgi:hypothetical protein